MKIIKDKLNEQYTLLLRYLKSGKYCKMLHIINHICDSYCMPITVYDKTYLTPYEKGPYRLDVYVNYSIVEHADRKYIAASQPVKDNIKGFRELMKHADITVSCISDLNYVGNPSVSIPVSFRGEILFFDEIYNEGRILRFANWADMDVLEIDKYEFFFKYFRGLNCKYPLVHCKAGVGRTGVFIMYDILYGYTVDESTFLNILLNLRSQRNGLVYSTVQLKFLAETFIKTLL
ncbi:hypothetical protein P3W45_001266 [Vairimorpha bombi]|jgi:protein tyrosine phosphatase